MPRPIPHQAFKDAPPVATSPAVQCEGKRRYESPHAANKAQRRGGRKFRLYRCPHCHGWHFSGSVSPGTIRKRAKK